MKKSSTIFLQVVIILVGVGSLALLLWEPHLEGRNAHATAFEIYFRDPFLAYAYTGSIFFFLALYKAFRLLGYTRQNTMFSIDAVKALRTIKHCAMIIVGFVLGAVGYLFTVTRHSDDVAGGLAIFLLLIFIFTVIATATAVFERILKKAVDIKSENDLTV